MKILLTNDDGFYAEGLSVLIDALKGEHDLYLCAPKNHMSGMGHAITVTRPIEVEKQTVEGVLSAYVVDGTPSDCAKVACLHLFKDIVFDLVISGINNGANMGEDIIYSGTVSAAHEAYRYGYHAIALSLSNKDRTKPLNYKYAVEHFIEYLKTLKKLEKPFLYNINYPYNQKPKGLKYAYPSVVNYKERIETSGDKEKFSIQFFGTPINASRSKNNDFELLNLGYATIVPVKLSVYDDHIDYNMKKHI